MVGCTHCVSSAWHTGGSSERGRIHEWCSLEPVSHVTLQQLSISLAWTLCDLDSANLRVLGNVDNE